MKHSRKGLFCASEVSGRERIVERPKWQSDFRALQQALGSDFLFTMLKWGRKRAGCALAWCGVKPLRGKVHSDVTCDSAGQLRFCVEIVLVRAAVFWLQDIFSVHWFIPADYLKKKKSVAVWKLIPPSIGWGWVAGAPNCDNPTRN